MLDSSGLMPALRRASMTANGVCRVLRTSIASCTRDIQHMVPHAVRLADRPACRCADAMQQRERKTHCVRPARRRRAHRAGLEATAPCERWCGKTIRGCHSESGRNMAHRKCLGQFCAEDLELGGFKKSTGKVYICIGVL